MDDPARGSVAEVARVFLALGCTSFGGPVAHVGYLRAECVARRAWLDEATFADLVALCQFLPGPASSQLVFALGMRRAGLAGAVAASLAFLLPSAAAMIAFAAAVASVGRLDRAPWLHGLKLAAVAVVAQAVGAMGTKLCPDRPRLALCVLSAAVVLVAQHPAASVAALGLGALVGLRALREPSPPPPPPPPPTGHRGALAALGLFALLLAAAPVVARASGTLHARLFDAFYRAGALVFGGGHVVLPLLRASVVPTGWITDDALLAGYGAAQAVPGPLFSFAGYLGAAIDPGAHRVATGAWCLAAVFLPGWLLVGGALPFWERLRARADAQAALRGANASVVGVLLAALYHPVATSGVRGPRDMALALVAWAALELLRAPPWAVVAACAAVAQVFAG